jgi:hypothetical protein
MAATNKRVYITNNTGTFVNRTPQRSAPLPANCITTSNTFSTISIAQKSHGLIVGDRVLLSGASAVGGITANQINTALTVTSVTDVDNYVLTTTGTATSSTTGGGSSIRVYANRQFFVPLGTNPIALTSGSRSAVITHNSHGCSVGDYVKISGSATYSYGGLGATASYTGDYEIVSATTNTFTITLANASDTTNATTGGSDMVAAYELGSGSTVYSVGAGWGAGGWGNNGWGQTVADAEEEFSSQVRVWSGDQFGEDIIACPKGGPIYLFDNSKGADAVNGATARLEEISMISGAQNCPTAANFVLVGAEDRRVFAFGTTNYGTTTFDPMLIRWSNEEDQSNWTVSSTTTAGYKRLSYGSEIVCAIKTKGEILVFTDTALYSIRPSDKFVYGVYLISSNIDILGPSSAIAVDDVVIWMGRENFFMYDGTVNVLPSTIRQHVFEGINYSQSYKVACGSNRLFREIWWFYPSGTSEENDKYAVFNYSEKLWYYGTMGRSAWVDSGFGAFQYPIAASSDGYLYSHEDGFDDGSTTPATAISAWVKSGPLEIESGNRFSFVRKIVPDITFENSTADDPAVTMTVIPKNYPGSTEGSSDSEDIARAAEVPVERFTTKKGIRVRGRQILFKVSSDDLGVMWRLGVNRIEVRPDGAK